MMANRLRDWRSLPLAPTVGAMFGLVAAILMLAAPNWRLENAVVTSGLADVVAFARPPLGLKARGLMMLLAFLIVGGGIWALVALAERLVARRDRVSRDDALDLEPFVEPADDFAPIRKPIFADRELGAPFMSDEILGRPSPVAAVTSVVDPDEAPLGAALAAEEFTLAPSETPSEPLPGETSLDALVRRLEAGMARRRNPHPPQPPTSGLADAYADRQDDTAQNEAATQQALGTLRRMARG